MIQTVLTEAIDIRGVEESGSVSSPEGASP